jgi:hypothetical protein
VVMLGLGGGAGSGLWWCWPKGVAGEQVMVVVRGQLSNSPHSFFSINVSGHVPTILPKYMLVVNNFIRSQR